MTKNEIISKMDQNTKAIRKLIIGSRDCKRLQNLRKERRKLQQAYLKCLPALKICPECKDVFQGKYKVPGERCSACKGKEND